MSDDILRQLDRWPARWRRARLVIVNERSADNLEKVYTLDGVAFDSLFIKLDAATERALIFGRRWLTAKPKTHLEAVVGHAVQRDDLRLGGESSVCRA